MKHLRPISPDEVRTLTVPREGETRVGERVTVLAPGAQPTGRARIALLGVPEDVGVRANLGRPGARRMWRAFLPRFLNMQSNAFLDGAAIAVAGTVEVRDVRRSTKGLDAASGGPRSRAEAAEALRRATAEIDERVAAAVEGLRREGFVPVVVGGGHNNAYGVLAGCATALGGRAMGCVNVDLHADLRPMEGRHSGNPFTYALERGHLGRYAVVGMSEAYATQAIVEKVAGDPRIQAITLESMLRSGTPPQQAALAAAAHVGAGPATVELDLDAVAGAPASAAAASGFTGAEFRAMAIALVRALDVHAVHVAEGAPALGPWPADMLGKLCAEVVRDACAAILSK
jgi:formiminoglutamase